VRGRRRTASRFSPVTWRCSIACGPTTFLVNSPLSLVNDKPRTLALLKAGRIRHTSLTLEIERISCHGDVVVVMGRDSVTDGPEQVVSHRRFTNLWRLDGGAWRCFARHANVERREPAA
jgi:limonene-1,2-epoxide hydrolase